jgi:hypothetical protein
MFVVSDESVILALVGLVGGGLLLLPFWLLREGLLYELGSPVPMGVVLAINDRGVRVGALLTRRSHLVAWPDVTRLRIVSRFEGSENGEDEYSFFLEVLRANPPDLYTVSLADMSISAIISAVDQFAPHGFAVDDERSSDSVDG